jgi:hypothetical protein
MPPHHVISSLAALLAAPGTPVLSASRVRAARPALSSDLPGVAVGMALTAANTVAPSRFQREGDQLVRNVGRFTVQAGANGWSADLRALDLTPLPVKHKPPANLDDVDIAVTNVTGTPTTYRLVVTPTATDEYRFDFARGRVVFGAPQANGDTLEIAHWTLSWREPIRWERLQGALLLELWSASAADAATLAERLQDRLGEAALPRTYGFLKLAPQRVESAESLQQTSGVGSPFAAWRQRLEYTFAHEFTGGGEATDGAAIRRIDVEIDDATPDSLTIGH